MVNFIFQFTSTSTNRSLFASEYSNAEIVLTSIWVTGLTMFILVCFILTFFTNCIPTLKSGLNPNKKIFLLHTLHYFSIRTVILIFIAFDLTTDLEWLILIILQCVFILKSLLRIFTSHVSQLVNLFSEIQILIVILYCFSLHIRKTLEENSKVSQTYVFSILYICYSSLITGILMLI